MLAFTLYKAIEKALLKESFHHVRSYSENKSKLTSLSACLIGVDVAAVPVVDDAADEADKDFTWDGVVPMPCEEVEGASGFTVILIELIEKEDLNVCD